MDLQQGLSKFGFTELPYRVVPPEDIPPEYLTWSRDPKHEKLIKTGVQQVVDLSAFSGIMLVGEAGGGKSYTIQYIVKRLFSDYQKQGKQIFHVKVVIPPEEKVTFLDIYQSFLENLKPELPALLGRVWRKCHDLAAQLLKEGQIAAADMEKKAEEILHESVQRNTMMAETIRKYIQDPSVFDGLFDDLLKYPERTKKAQNKRAMELMGGIIHMLTYQYKGSAPPYDAFFLVFDEIEAMRKTRDAIKYSVGQAIRDLINLNQSRFGIVMALGARSLDDFNEYFSEQEPLKRRFTFVYVIPEIDEGEGPKFVEKLHKVYKKSSKDALAPFSDKSIRYLVKMLREKGQLVYPGLLLTKLHFLFWQLCQENEKQVNEKMIDKYQEEL